MGEIDRAGQRAESGGAWEVKWGRRGDEERPAKRDRGSFYFFFVPTSGAAQTIDIAR